MTLFFILGSIIMGYFIARWFWRRLIIVGFILLIIALDTHNLSVGLWAILLIGYNLYQLHQVHLIERKVIPADAPTPVGVRLD